MAVGGARIVVAERWSVLRRGLTGVLQTNHDVVAELDDVPGLLAVLRARPVDLVIVGHDTGADPVAVLAAIAGVAPVPVLLLSDDIDVDRLRRTLQAGAQGVLSKKSEDAALLDGVARVLDGDRVIDQHYLPLLFGAIDLEEEEVSAPSLLTPREREVLALLARGASNRQIAEELLVGEATVKTHLARIYAKLDVGGRHHAVGRALELGLLG